MPGIIPTIESMIPVRATRRTLFAIATGLAFLSATGYSAAQVAQINAPGIDAQALQPVTT
ncbi:hypothetical protein [Burkholderia sp. PAMC 28687]|uniref:hypothetical protein n=1 Tax=Burkholderia sp. PAMC 28687 TaxID=1795874 RepID=UPI000B00FE2E|nr:hypothetical protein [Burkholderia sp. PAMC 28687]